MAVKYFELKARCLTDSPDATVKRYGSVRGFQSEIAEVKELDWVRKKIRTKKTHCTFYFIVTA